MKEPTRIEYTLALQAQAGDRDAAAELTARMRARLFALAYAELKHYEDAQDALAAGLLQICRHIGDLREPERVVAWMQSIVRNEARRLRRGAPAPLSLTEGDIDASSPPESEEYCDLLLRIDIESALRRIPASQAEAMRQFYFSGQPIQDIAEGMGVSSAVIKMWLHRGRRHLRTEMEGYGPMITQTARTVKEAATTRTAAILHGGSDGLESDLRLRMAAALRSAGYMPRFLTTKDLGEPGSTEPGLWDILHGYDAFVLVEPLGMRSVFEYILLLRASWETAEVPVAVVTETTRPDPFRALAFHTLGVAGLASRDAPESLDYLFRWTGGTGMSREARSVILFADDEARRAGQELIGTEHLLLGLLRDGETVRLLQEKIGIPPDRIAGRVRQRMERRSEYGDSPWRVLTEQGEAILRLAREEAAGEPLRPKHLLLGLIREPNGLAGRILAEMGGTPERVRRAY